MHGSGPGGRIIKRDVLTAGGGVPSIKPVVVTPPGTPLPGGGGIPAPGFIASGASGLEAKTIPLTNMRKTIARRLVESKTTIPHFTVSVAVDMAPLSELRSTFNKQLASEGVKLSVNDFIVRASALALMKHPGVNSSWSDSGIQQHGSVNVGIAVALPEEKGGGLVVATIRDTASKGVRQIGSETRALAKKAREEGLSLEEMSDGRLRYRTWGCSGWIISRRLSIRLKPRSWRLGRR